MRVHFSTDDVPPRDRGQFWLDFVAKQTLRFTPATGQIVRRFGGNSRSGLGLAISVSLDRMAASR